MNMIGYEQDPDVVRWGLHLLDICSLSNVGSGSSVTRYDADLSQVEYVREGYYEEQHNSVENDEIIAHALQEELSHIAAAEASGLSNVGKDHLQASILAQDWLGPSKRHPGSGHDERQDDSSRKKEEADGIGVSSSCSSPEGKPLSGEDFSYSLEMTDESVLDGEVGKRLNQMVPVPHVPKVNGEIPSVDEATSDHERLLNRLQLYDLFELKVQGDGNCQLKANPRIYEGYVPMAYGEYLKKMSKNGEWGDHVTLQAAADTYGLKIFVLTSFKDTCYIEILPNIQKSNRVIFLSFWAEVHYNSIYPQEGKQIDMHSINTMNSVKKHVFFF
ncbi:OVARIAN TUMOR DOMAIN-containing deubiquitinating enzyme 9 isoform X3 [Vitis vinifera]|uniref:OVARIAN TUMOR DOMAIN-containing deubiquitinating enzyme 9 isoform X3 n=1 Tax=Vitis vinifera TaxID=29760 RepID=UPI002882F8C9|nr:OVARIAN TUMOR DOMAIN-containing deubiquitinating enzyme 9 isoform X3 [Vitis vinifera]